MSYTGSFVWHSVNDLPGSDLTTVRFRITPVDSNAGLIAETNDFHLDNNVPPNLSFISTPSAEQSGDIEISFVSDDAEGDTLSYTYEYSKEGAGSWELATVSGSEQNAVTTGQNSILKVAGISKGGQSREKMWGKRMHSKSVFLSRDAGNNSETTALSSDTLFVLWRSASDLFNEDLTTVRFRITPSDNDTGLALSTADFHVDNQTGPMVLNFSPKDTSLWNSPVHVTFDKGVIGSTLEGNVTLDGRKSGSITGAISYNPATFTMTFTPLVSFTALDTITVSLSSSIMDSLLNGLDGDADGDPEGSPVDDFSWEFTTPLLGDYDHSNTIDYRDLARFIAAWNSDDYQYELGPAEGEVPWLRPQPDGVFDIEDMGIFIQMWNRSMNDESVLAKSSEEITYEVDSSHISIASRFDAERWSNSPGKIILEVKIDKLKGLLTSHLKLNYDSNDLILTNTRIGTIFSESDGEPVNFLQKDSIKGLVQLDISLIEKGTKGVEGPGQIAVFEFEGKRGIESEVYIEFALYDFKGELIEENILIHKVTTESLKPDAFVLMQNFPNPFNPITEIRYAVPEKSDVTLIIYNINGQEVIRWRRDGLKPGYYKQVWQGTNNNGVKVASGLYIYRLEAGNFVQSKKMLLLK